MKKFNLKEGVFAGTLFTILYIVIRLWQSDDYSTNAVLKMIVTGLIGGIFFGFIMGFFLRPKSDSNSEN